MELKLRKRIKNLPKFDGGKPSWLFSNPGLSYELPQQLDDFGFETDNSPQSLFFDNDINIAHFNITGRSKPYLYDDYPNIMDSMYNMLSPYFKKPSEVVNVLSQNASEPIRQPVQVLPKPTVVYSESFRRPDLNTPDYYRAGSLTQQNYAYHPQTINTPDFLGPAPAKPQLIVKANSNYRRPTQIDPDKVANQASIDKTADSVPMREFTLPDTEVVSNMPDWKALGYTSKEAYDNVVKFGSTVLGKEQHRALTGQKIASVVGGVANLAQNYIGQLSAVKSTEELMANAGTLNRSIGGVGYTRQNYSNDSLIMSSLNKSGLSSTLSGVASGAAAGAPFGWIGAGVGAVVGGLTGALGWGTSRNAQRKRLNNARQLTGRINTGNQAGAMTTALQQNYYSQNGNTGGVLYT